MRRKRVRLFRIWWNFASVTKETANPGSFFFGGGKRSGELTSYFSTTRAKVAAVAATPRCSQAHNLGHSNECLTAQCSLSAQPHFPAQHHFVAQAVYGATAECQLYSIDRVPPTSCHKLNKPYFCSILLCVYSYGFSTRFGRVLCKLC